MTKLDKQKGFTLVELAIVMTIIGLLIGGILKGQELMENARVTATIAQVKSYEAASTTFRDSFSALPGDMANASQRIPNCGAALCNPAVAASAGDTIVGQAAVAVNVGQANAAAGTGGLLGTVANETVLFWLHLLKADLIAGVSDAAITAGTAAWGETHPAGKIGGGFRVANGDGTFPVGNPGGAGTAGPSGLVLVLAGSPTAALNANRGVQALAPAKAAQIDRKMDDGKSRSGFIQAYGLPASCFNGGVGGDSYDERSTNRDCGLVFRIQG